MQRQQSWEQEMLPLRFAQVDHYTAGVLRKDWEQFKSGDFEWSYCVKEWKPAKTQDGDTIYIVTRLEGDFKGKMERSSRKGVECVDGNGRDLPILHAHPSGDCSPTRRDISVAIARPDAPFDMIQCGPSSFVSYSGKLYRDVLIARSTKQPPEEVQKLQHVQHDFSVTMVVLFAVTMIWWGLPRLHRALKR